ncbi:MAG TPA: TIGR02186 family protein [Dongiaceae bacterium]|nr:TIGR02186 family protein [Dongiaceae bacterium]
MSRAVSWHRPIGFALLATALLATAFLALAGRPAAAKSIVADIDHHLIAITTDFSGDEVLIFGAVDQPGDVVMALWGPLTQVQVHRKERVAGIWINRQMVTFGDVPSFYGLASSRPLADILTPAALDQYQLGVGRLQIKTLSADSDTLQEVGDYQQALLQQREKASLYADKVGRVNFIGDTLFRANLRLPSTVPTGKFLVEVYLVRNGEIVDAQTIPLVISKVGFGADVYRFANRHGFAYGVVALILSLALGWLAHLIFRRR